MNSANFDPNSDDVFGRIATKYDFLCDIFSFGAHRLWKRTMIREICKLRHGTVLDIGSGTGHIAIGIAKQQEQKLNPLTIIASDVSAPMLDIARKKVANTDSGLPCVNFAMHDAHDLERIADNSIDIYTSAFVMKICDREKLLSEAMRVLRPGGKFYCLEASHIPINGIHKAYLKYMEWCVPIIARIATSGDKSAHDYLLKGIHDMPNQALFTAELKTYGFISVHHKNLSLGIVALHSAEKPD